MLGAAYSHERLQRLITGDSGSCKGSLHSSVHMKHREQHMLNAQVLVLEGVHFLPGILQHFPQSWRDARLAATVDFRQTFKLVVKDALCCRKITIGFLDDLWHHPIFLFQQNIQKMFRLNLAIIAYASQLGCLLNGLPRLICKPLYLHGRLLLL